MTGLLPGEREEEEEEEEEGPGHLEKGMKEKTDRMTTGPEATEEPAGLGEREMKEISGKMRKKEEEEGLIEQEGGIGEIGEIGKAGEAEIGELDEEIEVIEEEDLIDLI
jgi:hypothetical protein